MEKVYNYLLEEGEKSSKEIDDHFEDLPYPTIRNYLVELETRAFIKKRKMGISAYWSVRQEGEFSTESVPGELKLYWPNEKQDISIPEVLLKYQEKDSIDSKVLRSLYDLLADATKFAIEIYQGDESSRTLLADRLVTLQEDIDYLIEFLPQLLRTIQSLHEQKGRLIIDPFVRSLIVENPNFPMEYMRDLLIMGDEDWTKDQLNNMMLYKQEWLESLFLYVMNKPLSEEEIMQILPNLVEDKSEMADLLRTSVHPYWNGEDPDRDMYKKNKINKWYYDRMHSSKRIPELLRYIEQIRDAGVIQKVLGIKPEYCQQI